MEVSVEFQASSALLPAKDPVATEQNAGWASEPVWTFEPIPNLGVSSFNFQKRYPYGKSLVPVGYRAVISNIFITKGHTSYYELVRGPHVQK